MILSVIIPSYRDPLLFKTMGSLLENSQLGDGLEIIAVLDGYYPAEVMDDPRVRYVHLGRNRGMREAINAGVAVSRGKYIMRTDEHCAFGPGYDYHLTRKCSPDWIMTAKRYFLNPETWTIMDDPPVEHEKLVVQKGVKFSGVRWPEMDRKRSRMNISETMAMQGSMWLMERAWWNKVIGELQTDGYGPHYQDSHEMVFKTWEAGGKLVLNKYTWYAHKHRSFSRTHNEGTKENPANRGAGWKYSLDKWGDYYNNVVVPKWGL